MDQKSFFNRVTNGKKDIIQEIIDLMNQNDIEYCVILANEPIIWYEFKKQPMDERFDLPYLFEKLRMDKETAREFIPQFNVILD